MTLTQKDVKADISKIMSSLQNDEGLLASPWEAYKISCLYQAPCAIGYLLAAAYMYLFVSPAVEIIWGALAIVGVSLFFGLITYGYSLAYLSLPLAVREGSMVIGRIKKTYLKAVVCFVMINWIVAVGSILNEKIILVVPVAFLIGFFGCQLVLGLEMARYGISTVMQKSAELVKKI